MIRDRVGVVAEEGVEDAGARLKRQAADVVADAVEHDPGHVADDRDDVGAAQDGRAHVEGHQDRNVVRAETDAIARNVSLRTLQGEGFEIRPDVADGAVVVPLEGAVAGDRRRGIRIVRDRDQLAVVLVDAPQCRRRMRRTGACDEEREGGEGT